MFFKFVSLLQEKKHEESMLVLHIKEHSSIRRPITVNSTYSQVSMDMIQPELLISTQMQ